jgi:hypothetical protein
MQTVKIDEFQSQKQRKTHGSQVPLILAVGDSVKKEFTKHKTLVHLRTTTLLQQFGPPQAEEEE